MCPSPAGAHQLAAALPIIEVITEPGGEHNLPIASPAWSAQLLAPQPAAGREGAEPAFPREPGAAGVLGTFVPATRPLRWH